MVKRNEAHEELPVREQPRQVRLTSNMSLPRLSAVEIGSYAVILFGMWAVLEWRLLGAMLAGMLVYQLVHAIAPAIERHMSSQRARWLAVVILATVVVGGLTSLAIGMIEHFEHTVPNIQTLLEQVMQIVEQARTRVPEWNSAMLPVDAAHMKEKARMLVHTHQGGDFQLQAASVVAGVLILAVILQAVAHQPRAVAQVVLQVLLERLEMGITQ